MLKPHEPRRRAALEDKPDSAHAQILSSVFLTLTNHFQAFPLCQTGHPFGCRHRHCRFWYLILKKDGKDLPRDWTESLPHCKIRTTCAGFTSIQRKQVNFWQKKCHWQSWCKGTRANSTRSSLLARSSLGSQSAQPSGGSASPSLISHISLNDLCRGLWPWA